jgi:hypothetical protein
MVDDEVHRLERIDLRGTAAESGERVAHRGEVHHAGHAGEVLQEDPRGAEGDLLVHGLLHIPGGECLDVVGLHECAILVSQQVLEEHLEREGERRRGRAGK